MFIFRYKITKDDLKGTGLLQFYDCIFRFERFPKDIPSINDFFKELLNVTPCDNSIFAICDARSWTPEAFFYSTYDAMAESFIKFYEYNTVKWEDCDDTALENWIEGLDELSEIEYLEINSSGTIEWE